jgi:hypothetical protein
MSGTNEAEAMREAAKAAAARLADAEDAAARLAGGNTGSTGDIVIETGADQGDADEDVSAGTATSGAPRGGGRSNPPAPARRATVNTSDRGGLSVEDILSDTAQSDATDELTMIHNAQAYAEAALKVKDDPARLGRIKAKLERDDPELIPYLPQAIMDLLERGTPPAATPSGTSGGNATDTHRLSSETGTPGELYKSPTYVVAVEADGQVRISTTDGSSAVRKPKADWEAQLPPGPTARDYEKAAAFFLRTRSGGLARLSGNNRTALLIGAIVVGLLSFAIFFSPLAGAVGKALLSSEAEANADLMDIVGKVELVIAAVAAYATAVFAYRLGEKHLQ